MSPPVVPLSLKDAPALIERLLPVQKLSAEVFKERKAGPGQTSVPLGAYWKGRKPLILNKACVLGSLLPATKSPARDLEVFEMLMAMDAESFAARWKRSPRRERFLGNFRLRASPTTSSLRRTTSYLYRPQLTGQGLSTPTSG